MLGVRLEAVRRGRRGLCRAARGTMMRVGKTRRSRVSLSAGPARHVDYAILSASRVRSSAARENSQLPSYLRFPRSGPVQRTQVVARRSLPLLPPPIQLFSRPKTSFLRQQRRTGTRSDTYFTAPAIFGTYPRGAAAAPRQIDITKLTKNNSTSAWECAAAFWMC